MKFLFKFFLLISGVTICKCLIKNENSSIVQLKKFNQDQIVLNSVYDAMKNNVQMKMNKVNFIGDFRNRRNANYVDDYPDYFESVGTNASDNDNFFDRIINNDNHAKGYRRYGQRFRDKNNNNNKNYQNFGDDRVDYGHYEESSYVKCHDSKPTVHTIELESGKSHFQESFYALLLVGLKYLLGGIVLLTLPFVIAKAVLLPLKFLIGLKVIALANTLLFGYYLLKFVRRFFRFPFSTPVPVVTTGILKSNQKLESIKQILNQGNYQTDDELSETEDNGEPRIEVETSTPTAEDHYEEQLLRDLIRLIKKRNKNW